MTRTEILQSACFLHVCAWAACPQIQRRSDQRLKEWHQARPPTSHGRGQPLCIASLSLACCHGACRKAWRACVGDAQIAAPVSTKGKREVNACAYLGRYLHVLKC